MKTQDSIADCLAEIDRLNKVVDQAIAVILWSREYLVLSEIRERYHELSELIAAELERRSKA